MAQRQFRTDDTSLWTDRYGQGSDGALTVSGNVTDSPTDATCTGTSGTTSLSATNASFAAGQLILIHQTQGTGAGNWELNRISSYSTGTITTSYSLINSYNTGAQVIVMKQYTNITVNGSVTLSCKAWDGSVGGIIAYLATGTVTITGNISVNGASGSNETRQSGGGWRGGNGGTESGRCEGQSGESDIGDGPWNGGDNSNSSTNGAGGQGGLGHIGGGTANSGGGGGHSTAGGSGGGSSSTAGGTTLSDNANSTTMLFGGGGGGGGKSPGNPAPIRGGAGGNGGGICLIIGKTITITGGVTSTGGNGGNGQQIPRDESGGGSGGAGGFLVFKGQLVTLGSSLCTASGGSGGSGSKSGENGVSGGSGRIHAEYSQLLSGTTNPTVDSVQDVIFDDLPLEQNYTLLM